MASIKSITRKAAIKALSGLYKRANNFDLSKCAYCGSERQALDHVPPLVYAYSYLDIDKFIKKGGKFLLYPCCNSCNGFMSDKKLLNYNERLLYLWNKYANLIKNNKWSAEEIEELGYNLKTIIIAHEIKRQELISRLRGVERAMAAMDMNED